MRGPELGVHADDVDAPDVEQDPKQEVLENKNVTSSIPFSSSKIHTQPSDIVSHTLDNWYLYLFQVVVQKVHIDGLGKTKEDCLTYEIAEVFRAKNLIDVSIHCT